MEFENTTETQRINIAIATDQLLTSSEGVKGILNHINTNLFNVYVITITQKSWFYESTEGCRIEVDKNNFTIELNKSKIEFDLVFINLNTDGRLQAYFDLIGMKYTSSGLLPSALARHKDFTKTLLSDISNLKLAKSKLIHKTDRLIDKIDEISSNLKFPLIVKPNDGCWSVGVNRVDQSKELAFAIGQSFLATNDVIVEEFIKGREFTVGVVQIKGLLTVFPVTEAICEGEQKILDYNAKYARNGVEFVTPGRVSSDEKAQIDKISIKIYEKLKCFGMIRIDFILEEKSGEFYFLEVNAVPGQRPHGHIQNQIEANGWTIKEFYTNLINETLNPTTIA